MKKYKQLNLEERVTIKVLLQQGKSKRAIARYLGRSPSTIHREICRGITLDGTYFAGLIRRFLPKGTNFDNITDEEIKIIENWINNRSMKVLGWKSPNEIFKSVAL